MARIPASVNKLYTTSAALVRYGDEGQLTTEALGDAQPDDDGVLKGNLYLRGGGDPEFGRAEARGLAQVLATSGLTRVTRRVIGDESHFDRLRGGPDSNYGVSEWVGPLSALSFNHGFTVASRPRFQKNPAYYAARQFERELRRAGVKISWHARAGVAPAAAETIGEWASPRMSVLIRHTNRPSDNYMAETLLKDLGADFGGAGTTAAGAAVARREAAKNGARPAMVDGSGPQPPEPHHAARRRRAARRRWTGARSRRRCGSRSPSRARTGRCPTACAARRPRAAAAPRPGR